MRPGWPQSLRIPDSAFRRDCDVGAGRQKILHHSSAVQQLEVSLEYGFNGIAELVDQQPAARAQ